MAKNEIVKNAFDKVYKDVCKDNLGTILERQIKKATEGKTQWKGIGQKWTPNTTDNFILLEVSELELDRIKKKEKGTPNSIFNHVFRDKKGTKEPIVYWADKGTPSEKRFLLRDEWGNNKLDLLDSTISFINSFGPYLSPLAITELKKATKAEKDADDGDEGTEKMTDDTSIPLNLILYGPPGTGKTYHTVNKALKILSPDTDWESAKREDAIKEFNRFKDIEKRIVFTTFHQSMSYEDFIEGIKPNLDGSSVGYKIQDGIFKQIAQTAAENGDKPYVLIIDEINRGNVANIFGELITLIEEDKRITLFDRTSGASKDNLEGIRVNLPYSKDDDFGVPGNLYIIGTMNTADRSVEALDSALRRRFSFEEMMPVPKLLESVTIDGIGMTLMVLLKTINERIEALKDREHQIGHSYFMGFVKKDAAGNVVKSTVSPDNLKTVFTDKIIPLLQEYFYGDYEKIQLVVGKGFVKEENNKPHFAVKNIEVDIPEKRFSIIDPDMKDALEKLFNPKDAAE